MTEIRSGEQLLSLSENVFIGEPPLMEDSLIRFSGKGNILFCEQGVRLRSSIIRFDGDNSLVVLGKSWHIYVVDFTLYNNSSMMLGRNVYFNGALHAIASEECSIVVGDECLFSFGAWMRTADPHLIYDGDTHDRINPSKSIFIGDHVWVGQDAMILKGSRVGSGSILGAKSVVSGKTIESNSSWGGNPAKRISRNLFWERSCVHTWTAETIEKHQNYPSNEFLFVPDDSTFTLDGLLGLADPRKSSERRLSEWLSVSYDNRKRNRFAIPFVDKEQTKGRRGFFKR